MEAAERAVTWGVGVQTAVSSLQRQRERDSRGKEKCRKMHKHSPVYPRLSSPEHAVRVPRLCVVCRQRSLALGSAA